MQAFCDKIFNWCTEIVSWEDGDNGIITKSTYQGHSVADSVLEVEEEEIIIDDKATAKEGTNGERTGLRKRLGAFLTVK